MILHFGISHWKARYTSVPPLPDPTVSEILVFSFHGSNRYQNPRIFRSKINCPFPILIFIKSWAHLFTVCPDSNSFCTMFLIPNNGTLRYLCISICSFVQPSFFKIFPDVYHLRSITTTFLDMFGQ